MLNFQEPLAAVDDHKNPHRNRLFVPLAAALLAALILSSALMTYRNVGAGVESNRNAHFVEAAGRSADAVGAAAAQYWSATSTAEALLSHKAPLSGRELLVSMRDIKSCLDPSLGIRSVITYDDHNQAYTSENKIVSWRNTDIFSNGLERQTVAGSLSHMDSADCIFFIQRQDRPLLAGSNRFTYICTAVDIARIRQVLDDTAVSELCPSCIVGPDGGRIDQPAGVGAVESYGVMTALSRCEYLDGGSPEEMRRCLTQRIGVSFSIRYGREYYLAILSPVAGTDWTVMTFVPSPVLDSMFADDILHAIRRLILAAGFAMLLAVVCIAMLAVRRSPSPVLSAGTEEIEERAAGAEKSGVLQHLPEEIRLPLAGIMDLTETALCSPEDGVQMLDCLKKIRSAAGSLMGVAVSTPDSVPEPDGHRVSRQPMELIQVLEYCAGVAEMYLQDRELTFVTEFRQPEFPHLLGDELHLRQVLINLLSNAVKFTPDGGKIHFRAEELENGADEVRLRIEVEDTGTGMPPELLSGIFDPAARQGSTGQGLLVAQEYAGLMGGTISVESRPGEGSRFTLEIPAWIDYKAAQPEETAPDGSGAENLQGIRLLLAEDSDMHMEIARCILEEYGIETVPVTNGLEALEAFAKNQAGTFDGILMDARMPVMDGAEAARAIRALDREDAKSIPIFAMAASTCEEDRLRCLEAGMDASIAKPIAGDALRHTLAQYIGPGCSKSDEKT